MPKIQFPSTYDSKDMPQRLVSIFDKLSPGQPRNRQAQPLSISKKRIGLPQFERENEPVDNNMPPNPPSKIVVKERTISSRQIIKQDHLNHLEKHKSEKMKILINHKGPKILMTVMTISHCYKR